MGKLEYGDDLMQALNDVCAAHKIQTGRIEAIGAVKKAKLGYYNQEAKEYEFFETYQPLEITSLTGNISLRHGKPFVHAHLTLSDKQGKLIGGHMVPGTEVFACEFVIQEFSGPVFKRGFDNTTGLPLWDF